MKETEKRMKTQTNVFGRIVKRYNMPLKAIDDLNNKYEEHKEKLGSFASSLYTTFTELSNLPVLKRFWFITPSFKLSCKNCESCFNTFLMFSISISFS